MNAVVYPPPWQLVIRSGTLEALKWLALACMVVDHVNASMYGRDLGAVADAIGRIAFPLFALVMAYNLSRPGADLSRSMRRLVGWGAVAQLPYALAFGYGLLPLNILFTFAAFVAVVALLERRHFVGALAVFALSGFVVEYAWAGVGLVLLFWVMLRLGDWHGLVYAALGLAGLCAWNGNTWALLAVPLVIAASYLDIRVPRHRWLFWIAYPAHLAVLSAIAVAGV